MSLASWYSSQYSAWNRTRRLQQPQFLARTDTNTSRVAAAMANNPAQSAAGATSGSEGGVSNPNKDKKASDPLFGPNIGPCSAGPAWTTAASRKKLITDDLTPEVLSSWVEKSKQSSQPTTTLQALVNLKRPTLRLSPLSAVPEDSEPHHQHLHGLEFEYDCDAPKCGIYVHVVLSKNHPEAAAVPSASHQAQILVFESVTAGGFAKRLTLEEGALLELGRYDHITPDSSTRPPDTSDDIPKSESTTDLAPDAANRSNSNNNNNNNNHNNRRRFTQFHFRKRSNNRSVSGPALAVVDADPQPTVQDSSPTPGKKDKEKEEEGIRVIIRLAALDEQGTELASPNEQTTFLHIVRLGSLEETEGEDNRPWVVKVVKREATIGPHTFQLHEIYGLTSTTNPAHPSSSSTTNNSTTSPTQSTLDNNINNTDSHTYPPSQQPQTNTTEEDSSSECLLCLSSPREVILIPCRHLVACKECALNMVEFGAGGNITHNTEPAVPPPAATTTSGGNNDDTPNSPSDANGTANGNGTSGTTGTTAMVPPITITTTRRKRKAKGWFCPVCRQPYTSLLRISTAAPPHDKEDPQSIDGDHHHHHHHNRIHSTSAGAGATSTTANSNSTTQNDTEPTTPTTSGGGLLGGAFSRPPAFLRGLSLGGGRNSSNSNSGSGTATPVPGSGAVIGLGGLQNDVESQAGLTRVGA